MLIVRLVHRQYHHVRELVWFAVFNSVEQISTTADLFEAVVCVHGSSGTAVNIDGDGRMFIHTRNDCVEGLFVCIQTSSV